MSELECIVQYFNEPLTLPALNPFLDRWGELTEENLGVVSRIEFPQEQAGEQLEYPFNN